MKPFTASVVASAGGNSYSNVYVVDRNVNPCDIGLAITCEGSAGYTVQHTFADPFSINLNTDVNVKWLNHVYLTNQTQNADGNYLAPPSAIRLLVSAATSASYAFTINQAG